MTSTKMTSTKMADNKYIRITRSMTRKAAQQQKDALITPLEIPLAIPQRTQLANQMKSKLQQQQRDTTNLDYVIILTIIIVLLLIVILKLYILIKN